MNTVSLFRLFKLKDIRISTKLLIINVLICSLFVLISLAALLVFHQTQVMIREVIAHDISEVTTNALTERELFSIQADTGLLLNTFFEKEEYLKKEGGRLLGITRDLMARNKGGDIERSLGAFSQNLTSLLQQCSAVNIVLRTLKVLDREVTERLDELENSISEKLIDLTIRGEDTGIMEQLTLLAAGYRTSLLEIGKMRAESWPWHYYREVDDGDEILEALDGLILRCRTITASDPVLAELGRRLIRTLQDFREKNLELHEVMSELNTRITALGKERKLIAAEMEALNRDVVKTVRALDSRIEGRLRITSITLLLLTLFLVAALGLSTSLFFQKIIKSPIEAIRGGIAGLQGGNLETRIRLGRNDEWSIIEKALNSMAEELSASYETLRFKEHIIESASITIATTDLDGRITYVNPAFLEAGGFEEPSEVIGRPAREFWTAGSRSNEIEIESTFNSTGSWRGEIMATRKDGSEFDVQIYTSVVLNAHGDPIGVMITSIDISE